MANWVSTAADYTFTGLKWYKYLFQPDRFWVDVQNNLKWLILGVVPTTYWQLSCWLICWSWRLSRG